MRTKGVLFPNDYFPASRELDVQRGVVLDCGVVVLPVEMAYVRPAGLSGRGDSVETYAAFLYSATSHGFTLWTAIP